MGFVGGVRAGCFGDRVADIRLCSHRGTNCESGPHFLRAQRRHRISRRPGATNGTSRMRPYGAPEAATPAMPGSRACMADERAGGDRPERATTASTTTGDTRTTRTTNTTTTARRRTRPRDPLPATSPSRPRSPSPRPTLTASLLLLLAHPHARSLPACRHPASGPPATCLGCPARFIWQVEEGGSSAKRWTPLPRKPRRTADFEPEAGRRRGDLLGPPEETTGRDHRPDAARITGALVLPAPGCRARYLLDFIGL
jgi:hypothetical protein